MEMPITPPRSSSSHRSSSQPSSPSYHMDSISNKDLAADLPDLNALPNDIDSLHTLLQSTHTALLSRNDIITSLHSHVNHLTSSHETMLTRSAEWKDELESLRVQVPHLKHQLMQTTAEKSELEDRVKDLRVRSEESRRAIMRLQGEQRTKADNRRSVAWNPHDIPPGLAEEHHDSSSSVAGPSTTTANKRSTIMFGTAAANKSRHTRTASGGRSSHFQPDDPSRQPSTLMGMRGSSPRLNSHDTHSDQGGDASDPVADSLATLSRRSSTLAPPSGHLMGLNINGTPLSASPASSSVGLSNSPSAPHSSSNANTTRGSRSLNLTPSPIIGSTSTSPVLEGNPSRFSPPSANDFQEQDSTATPSTLLGSRPVTIMSGGTTSQSRVMQIVRQKETELERLHSEMRQMRVRLDEALDAKRASDDCLKALKEFIGEGGPEGEAEARQALRGVKLPPLPTAAADDMPDESQAQEKTTWAATKWAQSLMSGTTTKKEDAHDTVSSPPSSHATLPTSSNTAPALSTLSSFFQRSPATTPGPTTTTAVAPPVPPKTSTKRESNSTTTGSDSSSDPIPVSNRLSTWFKRPPQIISTPSNEEVSVSSPPFKSLEESTLQPIQLNNDTGEKLVRKVSGHVSEDGATLQENGFVPPHFD